MRILIIEDDIDLRDYIRKHLEAESFAVDATADGERGMYLAQTNEYDAIILDLSLPRKDGMDICEDIRAAGNNTPIIVISETSDLPAKILLFDLGADDYIVKDFDMSELVARLRAQLRRPRTTEQSTLFIGDLYVNVNKQKVIRGEREIYLTRKEFSLLEYLMRHKGTVLSRGLLLEHVWNAESDPFTNTVEAHILNLRRKISREDDRELIHNIPGRGYKIDLMR